MQVNKDIVNWVMHTYISTLRWVYTLGAKPTLGSHVKGANFLYGNGPGCPQ